MVSDTNSRATSSPAYGPYVKITTEDSIEFVNCDETTPAEQQSIAQEIADRCCGGRDYSCPECGEGIDNSAKRGNSE